MNINMDENDFRRILGEELDSRIEPLATTKEVGTIIINTIGPLLTRLNGIDELILEIKEMNELQGSLVNLMEKIIVASETWASAISESIETSKKSIQKNKKAISKLESRLDDLIVA